MKRLLAFAGPALPLLAQAHEVAEPALHDPWRWDGPAWLWLLWGLPGALVLAGIARLWQQAGIGAGMTRLQAACFLAGWLSLGAALLSPLEGGGQVLFWVHMVQHETMMLVAAPLLVLSRPLGAFMWGLPAGWRPGAALLARRLGLSSAMAALTRPVVAWLFHAAALWAWHVPAFFTAALQHEWVHDLQHVSFLVSALAFWWACLPARAASVRTGAALALLFTTAVHSSALGALLTFSTRSWYAVYADRAPAWGWTALDDQQLGGLIMWVPGGAVFMVAALALCAAWLRGGASPQVPPASPVRGAAGTPGTVAPP